MHKLIRVFKRVKKYILFTLNKTASLKVSTLFAIVIVLSLLSIERAHAATAAPELTPSAPTVLVIPTPDGIDSSLAASFDGAYNASVLPDLLILKVQGYGGDAQSLMRINSVIKYLQGQGTKVQADVIAPAYSADALLVCAADKVNMRNGATLMFHRGAYERSFFLGLWTIRASGRSPSIDAMMAELFAECGKKKLLSSEQIEAIYRGKAVWLTMSNNHLTARVTDDFSDTPDVTVIASNIVALAVVAMLLAGLIVVGVKTFKFLNK